MMKINKASSKGSSKCARYEKQIAKWKKAFIQAYYEWNGIPSQKIIRNYLGIKPLNEPRFIYEFKYDYSKNLDKVILLHMYDPDTVNQMITPIFDLSEVTA
jgi:hypothetical protein